MTGRRRNPFREWIGALIRADVYGWDPPGRPGPRRPSWPGADAASPHRNGVYGAMFVAAAASIAVVAGRWTSASPPASRSCPPRSRSPRRSASASDRATRAPDFETVVDRLHERTATSTGSTCSPTRRWWRPRSPRGGDFTASIAGAVAGGWDTDSNGATVGVDRGLLAGAGALPAEWTAPCENRLATQRRRLRRHRLRRAHPPHPGGHERRAAAPRSTARPRADRPPHDPCRCTRRIDSDLSPMRQDLRRPRRPGGLARVAGPAARGGGPRPAAAGLHRGTAVRRPLGEHCFTVAWSGSGTSSCTTASAGVHPRRVPRRRRRRLRRLRRGGAVARVPGDRHRRAQPVRLLPRRTGAGRAGRRPSSGAACGCSSTTTRGTSAPGGAGAATPRSWPRSPPSSASTGSSWTR